MNRAKLNLYIDVAMIILFVIAAITSIILFFDSKGHDLKTIHNYTGLAFIALMTIHIALHLNCMIAMLKKR